VVRASHVRSRRIAALGGGLLAGSELLHHTRIHHAAASSLGPTRGKLNFVQRQRCCIAVRHHLAYSSYGFIRFILVADVHFSVCLNVSRVIHRVLPLILRAPSCRWQTKLAFAHQVAVTLNRALPPRQAIICRAAR
jgi:hypothetical protein